MPISRDKIDGVAEEIMNALRHEWDLPPKVIGDTASKEYLEWRRAAMAAINKLKQYGVRI